MRRANISTIFYGFLLYDRLRSLGILDPDDRRPKPVFTLSLMAVCIALFFLPEELSHFFPFLFPPEAAYNLHAVCLQPAAIAFSFSHEWKRLIVSGLYHASQTHLYYNMASLLWKGVILEQRLGSGGFAGLATGLLISSHSLYVLLSYVLGDTEISSMHSCAVGISALLFALKIVIYHDDTMVHRYSAMFGFLIENRYAAWVELLLIHLMVPQSSLLGHLCGILAGLIWVYGGRTAAAAKLRTIWERIVAGRGYGHEQYEFWEDNHANANGNAARFRGGGQAAGHRIGNADNQQNRNDERPASSSASASASSSSASASASSSRVPAGVAGSASGVSLAPAANTYSAEVKALYDMGFRDRPASHRALVRTNGDVSRAAEILLSQPSR